MKMLGKALLGGIAGGFVGAIAYFIYLLSSSSPIHIASAKDIFLVPMPGILVGAVFGAIYPRPFLKLAEYILHVFP